MPFTSVSTPSSITINSVSTTNFSINVTINGTVSGRFYHAIAYVTGTTTAIGSANGTASGTTRALSITTNHSTLLTRANGASALTYYIRVFEFLNYTSFLNNETATDSKNSSAANLTISLRNSSTAISAYNLDTGGTVNTSWARPSTHSGWRTRVQVYANGVWIFTLQGLTGSSLSATMDSSEVAAMTNAMGGVSPGTISARIWTGWNLSGGATYLGYSEPTNTLTKSFYVASTCSISGSPILLDSNSGTQNITVSVANSGPTSGLTHDLTLSISGTSVGTGTINAPGSTTISINRATAAEVLKTASNGTLTLTCVTKLNDSSIGSNTATATIRPPIATVPSDSVANFSLNNVVPIKFTSFSNAYTYTAELLRSDNTVVATRTYSSQTAGSVSHNITLNSTERTNILNQITTDGTTQVTGLKLKISTLIGTTSIGSNTNGSGTCSYSASTISTFANLSAEGSGTLTLSSLVSEFTHDVMIRLGTAGTIIYSTTGAGTAPSVSFDATAIGAIYSAIAAAGSSLSHSIRVSITTKYGSRTIGSVLNNDSYSVTAPSSSISALPDPLTIGSNFNVSITRGSTYFTYYIDLWGGSATYNSANLVKTITASANSSSTSFSNQEWTKILSFFTSAGDTSTTLYARLRVFYGSNQIGSTTTSVSRSISASAFAFTAGNSASFNIEGTISNMTFSGGNSLLKASLNYKNVSTSIITKEFTGASSYTEPIIVAADRAAIYGAAAASSTSLVVSLDLTTMTPQGVRIGSISSISFTASYANGTISSFGTGLNFNLSSNPSLAIAATSSLLSHKVELLNNSSVLIVEKTIPTGESSLAGLIDSHRSNILSNLVSGETVIPVKIRLTTLYSGKVIGSSVTQDYSAIVSALTLSNVLGSAIDTANVSFGVSSIPTTLSGLVHYKVEIKSLTSTVFSSSAQTSSTQSCTFTANRATILNNFVAGSNSHALTLNVTTEIVGTTKRIGSVQSSTANMTILDPTISMIEGNLTLGLASANPFSITLTKGSALTSVTNTVRMVSTSPVLNLTIGTDLTGNVSNYAFNQSSLNTILALIPSTTSLAVRFEVSQFYSGKQLGSTISINRTLVIDTNVYKPSITSFTFTELVSSVVSLLGTNTAPIYIQNVSRPNIVTAFTIPNGANLSNATLSFSNQNTSTSNAAARTLTLAFSNPIAASGSVAPVLTVVDSRGISATMTGASKTISIYETPRVLSYDVQRAHNTLDQLDLEAGTRAGVMFSLQASSIKPSLTELNSLSYRVEFFPQVGDWTPLAPYQSLGAGNLSVVRNQSNPIVLGDINTFQTGFAYPFRFIFKDGLNETVYYLDTMPSVFIPFAISKYGISAGKVHSQTADNVFEAGGAIALSGQLKSTVATGTAPLVISSTTKVENLYANRADTLATARTLTIGSTGKTFNGSANVSWTLAEIGAAATSHSHTKSQITDFAHTHTLSEISNSGSLAAINTNASTSNYLRGDGTWVTPPNTTYSAGNGISLSSTTFSVAGGNGLVQETSGLALGTPSTLTTATTNATTATSHTHEVTFPVTSVAGKTGAVTLTAGDVGAAPASHTHNEYAQTQYNGSFNYLGGGYIAGGLEKPNWFGSGKLKLQMLRGAGTNTGAPDTWNDCLWLSSYTGGDVRSSNVLIFSKNSDRVGFSRQNFDSTSWGTYREFWHTGNLSQPAQSNWGSAPSSPRAGDMYFTT